MNRTTCRRQEYFSLNQKRFRSIATGQSVGIIKFFMLISTIFRINCVKGFFPRTTSSVCNSINQLQVRSIVASEKAVGSLSSNMGNRMKASFTFQSSSPLAMTRSTSSSSTTKMADNNSHCISLSIPTMEDMEEVGALIAIISHETDVLLLDGDLGAGK